MEKNEPLHQATGDEVADTSTSLSPLVRVPKEKPPLVPPVSQAPVPAPFKLPVGFSGDYLLGADNGIVCATKFASEEKKAYIVAAINAYGGAE